MELLINGGTTSGKILLLKEIIPIKDYYSKNIAIGTGNKGTMLGLFLEDKVKWEIHMAKRKDKKLQQNLHCLKFRPKGIGCREGNLSKNLEKVLAIKTKMKTENHLSQIEI